MNRCDGWCFHGTASGKGEPCLRRPALAVLLALLPTACGATAFRYQQTAAPAQDLTPVVTARDETFIVRLRNGTATPIYIDWSTARFVDVLFVERPLVLASEHNVGAPDVPLDPGATITYQLEPAHYYVPPDHLWARRNSLRERITYPEQFEETGGQARVVLRVGYCVGQQCTAPEACCAAPAARQTVEVSLTVSGEAGP